MGWRWRWLVHPGSLREACATLERARPTAVNLAYAVRRVAAAATRAPDGHAAEAALAAARALHAEEERSSAAIARLELSTSPARGGS